MVHLEYSGGVIALSKPWMDTIAGGTSYDQFGVRRRFMSYICLSEDTRRRRHLPHLRITFRPLRPRVDATNQGGDILQNLSSVMHDLNGVATSGARKAQLEQLPTGGLLMQCTSEQMPNPDSRIGLRQETDAFGLQTVTIKWQLTARDRQGMAASHRLFGAELGRAGLGRLWSSVIDDDNRWPKDLYGDEHNIGTTRMHKDPKFGVVDENCRVHGVANLYVAGSSVFPTEGAANPTLTIVALGLRLADHIKERLA